MYNWARWQNYNIITELIMYMDMYHMIYSTHHITEFFLLSKEGEIGNGVGVILVKYEIK